MGSIPDPAGGAHSAPQILLTGFKRPTSKGRGKEVGEGSPLLSFADIYPCRPALQYNKK